jgi:hypothetical protein
MQETERLCHRLGFVSVPVEVVNRPPEPITPRNVKTVLTNFFVLSIFGQFDYELETRLLKSENHFIAQHLVNWHG